MRCIVMFVGGAVEAKAEDQTVNAWCFCRGVECMAACNSTASKILETAQRGRCDRQGNARDSVGRGTHRAARYAHTNDVAECVLCQNANMCGWVRAHALMRACTRAYMRVCARTCVCVRACMRARVHMCVRACVLNALASRSPAHLCFLC